MKKFAACAVMFLLSIVPAFAADVNFDFCDPRNSVLCDGLAFLYEFEEDSDYSRWSKVSGPLFVEESFDVGRTTGKTDGTSTGYGVYFDDSGSYEDYLIISDLGGPSGSYSVSLWVKFDTLPGDGEEDVILSVRDGNGYIRHPRVSVVYSGGSEYFRFQIKESVSSDLVTVTHTTDLETGTWYHLSFGVYADPDPTSSSTLYREQVWVSVNAGPPVKASTDYPNSSFSGDFILGTWDTGASPTEFDGVIDQFGFWIGYLSESDVEQLYGGGQRLAYPFSGFNSRWDGLIAGWYLNEQSGDRADVLGDDAMSDNNTVGYINDATFGDVASFTRSSSEYLSDADPNSLDPDDADGWTICGWFYNTSTTGYQMVFTEYQDVQIYRETGAYQLQLFVNSTGTGNVTFTGNAWHFFVAWLDPSDNKPRLQIDNGTVYTASSAATVVDGGNALDIGRRADGHYWDGYIHGIYVFDGVKSSAWRTDMYNSGSGRKYPN